MNANFIIAQGERLGERRRLLQRLEDLDRRWEELRDQELGESWMAAGELEAAAAEDLWTPADVGRALTLAQNALALLEEEIRQAACPAQPARVPAAA